MVNFTSRTGFCADPTCKYFRVCIEYTALEEMTGLLEEPKRNPHDVAVRGLSAKPLVPSVGCCKIRITPGTPQLMFTGRFDSAQSAWRIAILSEHTMLHLGPSCSGLHSRTIWVCILAASFSLNAFCQKVKVGYDKSVEFTRFKSYTWAEPSMPVTRQCA